MAAKNRRRPKSRNRFDVAGTAAFDERPVHTIPVRWVNTVIGLFLLPVAGILTQTLFSALSREAFQHGFWQTEEFWFFSLGAVLWAIMFLGLPKPVVVYVFGHELTHAIWSWAMGGRVSKFHVSGDGGHIITDKHNVFIALAPYFYPVYSIILLVAYAVLGFFTDPLPYHRWFFALLGGTWSFHITFTLWMIPKGQTDLSYHGTFFSLVLIYIMNLLLLSIMLIVAGPRVTWLSFARSFFHNTADFSSWVIHHAGQWIR
jgi:hypothetical protein